MPGRWRSDVNLNDIKVPSSMENCNTYCVRPLHATVIELDGGSVGDFGKTTDRKAGSMVLILCEPEVFDYIDGDSTSGRGNRWKVWRKTDN